MLKNLSILLCFSTLLHKSTQYIKFEKAYIKYIQCHTNIMSMFYNGFYLLCSQDRLLIELHTLGLLIM